MAGVWKKLKTGAAYFGVPLLFCLLIYTFLYIGVYPTVQPFIGTVELFISQSGNAASFTPTVLYDENAHIPTQEVLRPEQVTIPTIGALYGKLSVKRVDFSCPVYYGDSKDILKLGAGQLPGSMPPGFGKPTVISGHNNKEFGALQYLEINDLIYFNTHYGEFVYEIYDIRIIKTYEFDMTVLGENKEELILYTCYPFRSYGLGSDRYFVFARLLKGPTVDFGNAEGGAK